LTTRLVASGFGFGFELLSNSWQVMVKIVPAPTLAISGHKGLKEVCNIDTGFFDDHQCWCSTALHF